MDILLLPNAGQPHTRLTSHCVRPGNTVFFLTLLILLFKVPAFAQNSQGGGLWMDKKLNVNGRLEEWGELTSTNRATQLQYSIANNGGTLFLAFKSSDQANIAKILGGGMTVVINTSGKKSEKGAFVLQFPIKKSQDNLRSRFRSFSQSAGTPDSAALAERRAQLAGATRELAVAGFKEIQDSSISVYNLYGIRAAAAYDDNSALGIELAVPMALLGIKPGAEGEIACNVKLNGLSVPQRREGQEQNQGTGRMRGESGMRVGGGISRGGGGGGRGVGGFNMQDLFSTTDFWTRYNLIFK